ncbi:MAG: hypothetical protein SAJ12_21030 [Jaaginema sp. PMC 1079.18]|nr:hypothetical protein [Jaaginema sp. PMC 1080.18]MEC4853471.1 hypothetical protein [Jaaginema sp. PMC 1079.18]MEC4869078.1 hypothetical protein [Jaaginema sp. PMC 1078.18]
MAFGDTQFDSASQVWDLTKLYRDLALVKGKSLTPVEKLHLKGLLCGYSPAKIAQSRKKKQKGVEVNLCNTLYQYVKALVDKSDEKIKNWRNITQWLEEAGYKMEESAEFKDGDSLSFNIVVNKAKINIDKNKVLVDINIKLAAALPSDEEDEIVFENNCVEDNDIDRNGNS